MKKIFSQKITLVLVLILGVGLAGLIGYLIFSKGEPLSVDQKPAETEAITDESPDLNEPVWRYIVAPVGQADAAILLNPQGQVAVIDAATAGGIESVIRLLNKLNINRIETLVLTHPHADHIGGASRLIEQFDVGQVWDIKNQQTTGLYLSLLELIDQKEIPYYTVSRTEKKELLPEFFVEIINPTDPPRGDLNQDSISFPIEINGVKILTTGDAYTQQENQWVREGLISDIDILKAGHHGSRTSTGRRLLETTRPEVAIIPAPRNGPFGHPHAEVVNRLEEFDVEIYQTGYDGFVKVRVNPQKEAGTYEIRTFDYLSLFDRFQPEIIRELLNINLLTDDFSKEFEYYGAAENHYEFQENKLILTVKQPSELWYHSQTAPQLYWKGSLPENWKLTTNLEVELIWGRETGIILKKDANNWLHWGPTGDGNSIRMMVNKAGEEIVNVRNYSGLPEKIGLALQEDKIIPLFKQAGETYWRKLNGYKPPFETEKAQAGIYAKSWAEGAGYEVIFSNLKITEIE